ncbi:MetQ/NlpA family ABC transporter substrate-binding protein [Gluconobacter wancherniae]|uniref:Lipoprotein n=1 Tax=Gluconobacter wancherniae NBRC 103581 TaxID=656744 RepID=A0A511AZV2_9PROT|nr:MetQ/NlpA family ABC transporter substrate-binding protein [Gluconobacter wancherniae]GBD55995.1 lipoprotein [Gluconobacter wancherniae NBRC 103581]GBR62994.1 D-methionine transporter substrate-binding periplasmic protein [Gluconobacter wancherniae NBRC 103581]GEK93102.1 lipoprotein [Gluconobacter wancherniae NBRC 103581]
MPALSLSRRAALGAFAAAMLIKNANAQSNTTLRIGIMSGEDEDIWRIVSTNASKSGLTLKIVTFSDYSTPNQALSEGDLDANAFQHGPFLKAQSEANGFKITPVGNTYFAPMGLYSHRWKSLQDLPPNASIGVPNDPSNEGRALLLLQTLGILKISSSAGLLPTALDITDNPRNISIRELDAGVVGRALTDLDAAVVNTEWAQKAGIDTIKERIGEETLQNNPYVCFIATNAKDASAAWVKPLVSAYQQPNTRQALLDVYHGAIVPAWT